MITIIAGSRTVLDYAEVLSVIKESRFKITKIISGTANGVDKLGERYAMENNIPLERFPAKWDELGNSVGYLRNVEMSKIADALIAIRKNKSKGTSHMIQIATKEGLKIFVKELK